MESNFIHTSQINDFIGRYRFTGLRPGQEYFYQIKYGRDSTNLTTSKWNKLKTLNSISADKGVSFGVVTGLNYHAFRTWNYPGSSIQEKNDLVKSGFPVFHAISSIHPDFLVVNGNSVYYDIPVEFPALTRENMRKKWHWLASMQTYALMVSKIPLFWVLNDHDYLNSLYPNKSDNSSDPSVLQENCTGADLFYEQVPFVANETESMPAYRTYRLNKDVQIWMLEGRSYKKQNASPDKTVNSIFQTEQINWLKTTLKQSTSSFKLVISPTPLVGPVESGINANQISLVEFRSERDSLFQWLKNNGFRNNGLYFICGDVKWQYHSIDPAGFEEFSCGPAISADFQLGKAPGDTLSTDPGGTIVQPYIQNLPSGGVLTVNSDRDEFNSPVLLFRFLNENKKLLYAVNKY